jgi:hypothetical protein
MNRPIRLLISNLPLAQYWRTAVLSVFSPESVAPIVLVLNLWTGLYLIWPRFFGQVFGMRT